MIFDPARMTQRCRRTPSPITASGPMVTLGPILQFFPIFAEGSIKTFPPCTYGKLEEARSFELFFVREER